MSIIGEWDIIGTTRENSRGSIYKRLYEEILKRDE